MTKPDCTGQRFGRLTALGKSDRHPRTNQQLWRLQCDCGNIIERPRNHFDSNHLTSCGCARVEANRRTAVRKSSPDCTGQRFGQLTVLGLGGKRKRQDRNTYKQLWKLQCDCGKIIEVPKEAFSNGRQISCGCAKRLGLIDNKRRPVDISGQKFGTLTAIALTGRKDKYKKPTWKFECDCGSIRELSFSRIGTYNYYDIRINCGDRTQHPERWLEYPPTPNPYPKEAGELLTKYLPLTELSYQQINAAVEDEKRDRLLRAAWILAYRRSQGEEISELHEARYIRKCLQYCSIDVFWKRKIETNGGFLYTVNSNKKQIGIRMTDVTFNDYPVIETQGINLMSDNPTSKHLRFKRC